MKLISIQNLLIGNAKIVVNIQICIALKNIEATSRRKFSDQRDEVCLIVDLVSSKQAMKEFRKIYRSFNYS